MHVCHHMLLLLLLILLELKLIYRLLICIDSLHKILLWSLLFGILFLWDNAFHCLVILLWSQIWEIHKDGVILRKRDLLIILLLFIYCFFLDHCCWILISFFIILFKVILGEGSTRSARSSSTTAAEETVVILPFFVSLVMLVIVLHLTILCMYKLRLLSSSLSSYNLTRIVHLIVVVIIFLLGNSLWWLPTSSLSFISSRSLVLVYLSFSLLLLNKVLIIRIIKLCCVQKELLLLLLIRRWVKDNLFIWHHVLMWYLLLHWLHALRNKLVASNPLLRWIDTVHKRSTNTYDRLLLILRWLSYLLLRRWPCELWVVLEVHILKVL